MPVHMNVTLMVPDEVSVFDTLHVEHQSRQQFGLASTMRRQTHKDLGI
jgi:hypothetical protein